MRRKPIDLDLLISLKKEGKSNNDLVKILGINTNLIGEYVNQVIKEGRLNLEGIKKKDVWNKGNSDAIKVEKICSICGKQYIGFGNSKYCSDMCKSGEAKCLYCGAKIPRDHKYCSRKCSRRHIVSLPENINKFRDIQNRDDVKRKKSESMKKTFQNEETKIRHKEGIQRAYEQNKGKYDIINKPMEVIKKNNESKKISIIRKPIDLDLLVKLKKEGKINKELTSIFNINKNLLGKYVTQLITEGRLDYPKKKAWNKGLIKGNVVKCSYCEKEKTIPESTYNRNKSGKFYCNNECREYHTYEKRICDFCKKEYDAIRRSSQQFCSNKCKLDNCKDNAIKMSNSKKYLMKELRQSDNLIEKEKDFYDEFLNEARLERYLKEIFHVYFIRDRAIPELEKKIRPDYRNKELMLIVEFDGPTHYQKTSQIHKDQENEIIYKSLGYKVVRIPFFIQITKDIIVKLFNLDLNQIENLQECKYSHGFIHKNVVTPEDFCFSGLLRFEKDLQFFNSVSAIILKTMIDKIEFKKINLELIPQQLLKYF